MGKYFGTDGFRGEANVDLKVTHAYKVGRYLGYYYGKDHRPTMVIGKDTRRSSYMFEYALVAGLTASGADVNGLYIAVVLNDLHFLYIGLPGFICTSADLATVDADPMPGLMALLTNFTFRHLYCTSSLYP